MNRSSTHHYVLVVGFALVWVLAGCGGPSGSSGTAAREGLEPLPQPDLSAFEAAVQKSLGAAQQRLASATEESASETELAEAYGQLGRHFHVYELLAAAEASYRNARTLAPEDFRWTYHLAIILQSTGRLPEAADLYRQALKTRPEDLPTWVRLAEALIDNGQLEGGEEALRRALELDPDCALAHYFLGLLEQTRGNAAQALEHLERVLELQPQASIVNYALAQALRSVGRSDEARHFASQVGSEEVRLVDPLMVSLDTLHSGAAAHIRRAAKAQVDGHFEAARREYELAIAADANNPEAHQGLGAMLVELGDIETAIEHFQTSLELGARNGAQVHFNLGALEISRGGLDIGLGHYDQALDIDPQLRAVDFAAAKALADAGRLDQAATRYQKILVDLPDNVPARLNLGLALARQGLRSQARRTFRQVLDLDATANETAQALSHLADLEAQQGQVAEAESLYREAAKADPEGGGAWFALGNFLGQQGRYAEAIAAYGASIEANPRQPAAWLGEATARALEEDWSNARKRLEEGLEQIPNHPDMQQALARLLVTCPDPSVRDVSQGRALAQQVFDQTRSLAVAELVAMGLAAEGRVDEAVQWQAEIVSRLERAGWAEAADGARAQLDHYRQLAASRE